MTPRRRQQLEKGEVIKALMSEAAPELAPTIAAMPEGQVREFIAVAPEQRIEVLRAAIADPAKLKPSTIKRAKAVVLDAATGQPEQQEFSFTFKTKPEHRDDAQWFVSLSEDDRAIVIATARRMRE